jgi:hypothetical protein
VKVKKVTAEILAEKITDYLLRRISIKELVDWSENMIMEAEYSDEDFESIREIVAHLGVADVRQFGLSWDDCYEFLDRLGYQLDIKVSKGRQR